MVALALKVWSIILMTLSSAFSVSPVPFFAFLTLAGRDTAHEVEGQFGYLVAGAFQQEVPAVEQVDLRIRYVVGEGAGAVRPEGWISLAPDSENWRAPAPQVLLQGRIERRIGCVVAD